MTITPSDHCTHGGDCTVHPEAQMLHNFDDVPTTKYECPECYRVRPWTDGRTVEAGDEVDEYWCQVCGAITPVADCREVKPGMATLPWEN